MAIYTQTKEGKPVLIKKGQSQEYKPFVCKKSKEQTPQSNKQLKETD